MAEILEMPPPTEEFLAERAFIEAIMERHVSRGPLGEWDVPAVAKYLIAMLRVRGFEIRRIK